VSTFPEVPVPFRATSKGDDAALLDDTLSKAEKLPMELGVNVTDAMHSLPAFNPEVRQVFVSLKLAAFVPVIATVIGLRPLEPELIMKTCPTWL
jgi:hypothetical protein